MADIGKISVIVPVYNGARFVSQAIDSILDQPYGNLELIVIDDGSTENTATVIQGYGNALRYEYQSNGGSSVARNHGCSLAAGDFLAFLDADDLWCRDRLEIQTEAFARDPGLDIVWGHVQEFYQGTAPGDSPARPLAGRHPGTALLRRRAFDVVGGFSEVHQQSEVVEWVTRIIEHDLRQIMLPNILMYRRIHSSNKGLFNKVAQMEYLKVLKMHLDRQR
jgi:glycosyltransferase involved in cell wall biosynthesis